MDSITKRKLNNTEINDLIKKAFGSEVEFIEVEDLTGGWYNAAYSITLTNSKEVILKVSPPTEIKTLPYEQDIMNTEVEMLIRMKKTGSIPVPEVLFYDSSKEYINSEYYFMDKLEGKPYHEVKECLSEQQKTRIEVELGRYNRLINDIKGSHFGYYSSKSKRYDRWSEAFTAFIHDILKDGEEYGIILPEEYEKIRELSMSKKHILDCVNEPGLVHWDLWDRNFFVDKNCKITGIIDFERALWGDPLMEMYFGNLYDRTNFCKGYGRKVQFSKEEEKRRVLYNFYISLIMVIEYKYRGYSHENHKSWAYNELKKDLEMLKKLN